MNRTIDVTNWVFLYILCNVISMLLAVGIMRAGQCVIDWLVAR